jgi:probable HAF family extracellular repeat protein
MMKRLQSHFDTAEANMKSRAMISIAMTLCASLVSFPLAAQENSTKPIQYSVQNLGTLGGVLGSSAHSINDQGQIAGVANLTGDSEEHAASWQSGRVSDLGTLGGDNSNVDFPVKNDSGLIVGFAQTSSTDPLGENFCTFYCNASGSACNGGSQSCRGFRWRDGLMQPLGTLGGNNSAATGANNRGLVVGLAETSTRDSNCLPPQVLDYEAVVWQGQSIDELSPVPGDAIGAALAVNDNDQVVGASGSCGSGPGLMPGFMHAVLWTNHSPIDLGNLGGAYNNVAYAINNREQIVGASDLQGDSTGHAFLWQNGVMTDLGTLAGDVLSFAYAINDRGEAVGQSCDASFNCRAFLWQNGAMTDLNAVAAGSPLYLIDALDINSRGEIVGIGVDQNTTEQLAFVAVPCDQEHAGTQQCQDAQNAIISAKGVVAVVGSNAAVSTNSLPDHVRASLRQRMKLGPFGRTHAVVPAHSTRANATALVSGLAGAKPSRSNAAQQSCGLGAYCDATHRCCVGLCGTERKCCDLPYVGQYCTLNVQCCYGSCINHRCGG